MESAIKPAAGSRREEYSGLKPLNPDVRGLRKLEAFCLP